MNLQKQLRSAGSDSLGADDGQVVQDAHIGIRSRKRAIIILSVGALILAVAAAALYKVMSKPATMPAFVQAQANASPTAAVTASNPAQPSPPTAEPNTVATRPAQAQPAPAPTAPVTVATMSTTAAVQAVPAVPSSTNPVTATSQAPAAPSAPAVAHAIQPKPVVTAAPGMPEQEKNVSEMAKAMPHKGVTKETKAVKIQGSRTAQPKNTAQPLEEKPAAKETMRAQVEETVSEEQIFLYR